VEGFAGSAIQLSLLDRLPTLPPGVALIFTHILNPFGMAWFRRANENNVDLNRNFILEGTYGGAPDHYEMLDAYVYPKTAPGRDFFLMKSSLLVLRYGLAATLQMVAGGQYEFPRNLFFGGKKIEPGLDKYHAFLRGSLAAAQRAITIDVHTGIGRFSKDLLIVEQEHYERVRQKFGSRVTPSRPKRLPAYQIRGGHHGLVSHALRHADVLFITQEFGTYNPLKVFHALREENRWHHYANGTLDHPTKRALKEVFCPKSETWRQRILSRGRDVFDQALLELGTVRN